jgi:hypothetical protein
MLLLLLLLEVHHKMASPKFYRWFFAFGVILHTIAGGIFFFPYSLWAVVPITLMTLVWLTRETGMISREQFMKTMLALLVMLILGVITLFTLPISLAVWAVIFGLGVIAFLIWLFIQADLITKATAAKIALFLIFLTVLAGLTYMFPQFLYLWGGIGFVGLLGFLLYVSDLITKETAAQIGLFLLLSPFLGYIVYTYPVYGAPAVGALVLFALAYKAFFEVNYA